MAKEKTVTADEFRAERDRLERDRSTLNERLQALNAEREKTSQQLIMTAGALQTVSAFINRIDPEVDPEDEIDMSTSDPDEV
jgi:ABC-type phosphate transport system auxiliary subunit